MSSGVSLQIKGVIEALATEGAEISLGVTVALHVPVEEPLQGEGLPTHATGELAGSASHRMGGSFSISFFSGTSLTMGFLIPCPPLIISKGASGGIPN